MDRPEDAERGDGVAKPQCSLKLVWVCFRLLRSKGAEGWRASHNVEQNALANASKPSTMRMQGQRGILQGVGQNG